MKKESSKPKPNKRLSLFKKPGARNYTAHITMSDGHTENVDTGTSKMTAAMAKGLARVRALYVERGIKKPKKTGLSEYQRRIREKLGLPLTATKVEVVNAARVAKGKPPLWRTPEERAAFPKRRGRPRKDAIASIPEDAVPMMGLFGKFDARDEQVATKSLMEIIGYYLANIDEDTRTNNIKAVLLYFIKKKTK